jgi:hypothetical protein
VIPNRTITILNTDDLDGDAPIVRATKYVITDPVLADIRHSLTGFKGEEFRVTRLWRETPDGWVAKDEQPPSAPEQPGPDPDAPMEPIQEG